MRYSESGLPFEPSQSQSDYRNGSDAIDLWPQFPMNDNEHIDRHSPVEQHEPPYKRSRTTDNNGNRIMNGRNPPSNDLPVNNGVSNIFFKTRMCAKFRSGNCRNGENCNFAHGMHDLRQPPPNWQELVGGGVRDGEDDRLVVGNWDDDQRIIHKMKLCKKFYNGEECPYGDRCNFLHEGPSKFRDDTGKFRESSAISIGTNGHTMGQGAGRFGGSEVNRPASTNESDALRSNTKTVYWKTKLCTKWEITGQCPFGDKCHFAHGQAELQGAGGKAEGETGYTISTLAKSTSAVFLNVASVNSVPSSKEERQEKKCLLKWKQPKKLNKIYADWLNDIPLGPNLTNQVQSEV